MAQPATRKRKRGLLGWSIAALGGIALLCWGAFSLQRDASIGQAGIGSAALGTVRELTAFGPRPPASPAHLQAERYIVEKAQAAGWTVEQDRFTADTPAGAVAMNNILAKRKGASSRVLILATHYDTKRARDFRFMGANDGGSGTGLLLALAPILAKRNYNHSLWLVWLDGEEAFEQWSDNDSVYGSRHLAAKLKAEGTVPQIGAFVLVDMIGDRELDIRRESNSTPWLTDLVWKVAHRLGHKDSFLNSSLTITDDHIPFLQAGVPSVDLIDFNYGPNNRYWHTAEDTLDKLGAPSLQTVGEVLLEVVAELDRQ